MAGNAHIKLSIDSRIRIGPITLITLIAVVSLSVLAVLTAATAHASAAISERQAHATELLYLNETAGQEFLASVDATLSDVRSSKGSAQEGAQAVKQNLDTICQDARNMTNGKVQCTARVDGTKVTAEFISDSTRQLSVTITIHDDAMYRIDEWKASTTEQEAPSPGALWSGNK